MCLELEWESIVDNLTTISHFLLICNFWKWHVPLQVPRAITWVMYTEKKRRSNTYQCKHKSQGKDERRCMLRITHQHSIVWLWIRWDSCHWYHMWRDLSHLINSNVSLVLLMRHNKCINSINIWGFSNNELSFLWRLSD